MSDLKFELMEVIQKSSPVHPIEKGEVLNSHIGSICEYADALDNLISAGYVVQRYGSNSLFLTLNGVRALEDEQERREQLNLQKASIDLQKKSLHLQEKSLRESKKAAVTSLITAIATGAAAIIALIEIFLR